MPDKAGESDPKTQRAGELAELKTQRSSTKGCITRIKNLIDQKGESLSQPELECRLGILESYFKQILAFQSAIEKFEPEDQNEIKIRGELEDLYCATKSKLIQSLAGSRRVSFGDFNTTLNSPTSTSHLPKLKLPQFSGVYSEFPNFIGSFTTLVHKDNSLSSLEKFNHLLTCLKGPALRTIKAFEVTEANYTKALEHLRNRYDNKYLIFQEHVIKLFNLPKVVRNSSDTLRNLIDNINAHFSALQSLGSYEEIVNAFIIYLATSKLDSDSQTRWEESIEHSNLPKWTECANVLNRRCVYLESRDSKRCDIETVNTRQEKKGSYSKNIRGVVNTSLATTEQLCAFCYGKGHYIDKCPNFLGLPVFDRFTEVKKRVLCIKCLIKGHSVRKCKASNCRVCSLPHHTLLHRYATTVTPSGPTTVNEAAAIATEVVGQPIEKDQSCAVVSNDIVLPSSSFQTSSKSNHVFLATAVIKIKDKFGNFHLARALLDSASQLNFITEHLAQTLKLNRNKIDTCINGIGDICTTVRYTTRTSIRSRVNDFETKLDMYILPHITSMKPEKNIQINNWDIPKNISLADPQFFKPQKLDLLIGADLFFRLLCVGQIQIRAELPLLQKTLFGWIVSGRYSEQGTKYKDLSCHVVNCVDQDDVECNETDRELKAIVERFWNDENLDNFVPKWNEEQIQCEKLFTETHSRQRDGRFMVKLPFREQPSQLGHSIETARKRFGCLERKLHNDSNLKSAYSEFLREYLSSGHMEEISLKAVPDVHYFLPHHCVLRPESSTTKLRVVFDASCRTSSGKSLNDLLLVGPIIQDDLFSIVLRFRCYKFALTADIAAMYRQVLIDPADANFQLILWREISSEELRVFRLRTVTYGTSSAPFLATRCLLQLSKEFGEIYPQASRIIAKDFYMDDLITGADTFEELSAIRRDVELILNSAQFRLRKWYSNHQQFLQEIPETEREQLLRINDSDIVKTLGIIWEPKADEFRFHYNLLPSTRTTKRTILSDVAKLYDPLGLINPVVVKAKVFLQELWIMKLSWDESLSQDLAYRWKEFKKDLLSLQEIRIPRPVLLTAPVTLELHGFSDASNRAYGCCIYIRCSNLQGEVSVHLLTAKSKVAPIRVVRSLPCLELCAALLLVKLMHKVKGCLLKTIDKLYCWTDSEIVLDWISCPPSNWKTYVANRVSEIQRYEGLIWRHVNSKGNPADIVSRGANASELMGSIWFRGPQFLLQSSETWPPIKQRHDMSNIPERRKVKSILLAMISDEFLTTIYECSDYLKNCRRFAIVMRFIDNIRSKRRGNPRRVDVLSADEIDAAFLRLVWAIQQKQFGEAIREIEIKNELSNHNNLRKLNPFLEESSGLKILRVGGRLKNSDLPYDTRHPILLPQNNSFVMSYIRYLHFKNFHAGPQALVCILRQRFWVVNAREYCRKIVRRCIHCFRYRPKLGQQLMGELPKGRVTACLPFTHSGVDFCGPFQTTLNLRGKRTYKSYVAIFVCFVTKAVHIEVVSDLTTDAFVAALKRFVARRNRCQYLYCDNATNFVGAHRQLKELRDAFLQQTTQETIQHWCSNQGINFRFIPPRSPHFGGLWESCVKAAKGLLLRTLRNSLLTFEELNTVMVQIEAVLNSRPITPLSSDPNDEQALTPAHFLNQAPIQGLIEPSIPEQNFGYLRRWQRVSALQQHFWRRWSNEYLSQLQERSKWKSSHPNIKLGTLVLVHQDDAPSYRWKLGRVVAATPGPDGRVRVVSIKTAGHTIDRPIHKVAALPLEE